VVVSQQGERKNVKRKTKGWTTYFETYGVKRTVIHCSWRKHAVTHTTHSQPLDASNGPNYIFLCFPNFTQSSPNSRSTQFAKEKEHLIKTDWIFKLFDVENISKRNWLIWILQLIIDISKFWKGKNNKKGGVITATRGA